MTETVLGFPADLLPLVTAFAILAAAAIAAIVAIRNVSWQGEQAREQAERQFRQARLQADTQFAVEYSTLRYEATRAKRATAKALLSEISIMHTQITAFDPADPITAIPPKIYDALRSDIGRLDGSTIDAVVRFYSSYAWAQAGTGAKPRNLSDLAKTAETKLETFLEKTEEDISRHRAMMEETLARATASETDDNNS